MKSLLIIDDEPLVLDVLAMAFPDFAVVTCTTAAEGLKSFRSNRPDVVLCDIRLPDLSGLELFGKLQAIDNKTSIILMTGHGSSGTAIEAMQKGAFEYVLKPLDPDQLIPLVESAYESSRMMRVPARLPDDHDSSDPGSPNANSPNASGDQLIGECPAMQDVYRAIGRVASQNVTVLIMGESGTGKEVIARAIYHYGRRAGEKFLAINCAAIPEQLLESELFGHEKGAFTGADRKRIGKFEQCSAGTLFLDEIGDMPPLMQAKILRVLQDQSFERVGGTEMIKTNARLIAATNRELEAMIETGKFRRDLFYRLNVYLIKLPPRRERGQDIMRLAQHFLRAYATELNKQVTGISVDTEQLLKSYRWPGNVRELQSVIKHALLEATGPVLVPTFLPELVRGTAAQAAAKTITHDQRADSYPGGDVLRSFQEDAGDQNGETIDEMLERHCQSETNIYESVIDEFERKLITKLLNECGGNQTEVARRLGVTRTTIRAKIDKLDIAIQKIAE